MPAFSIKSQVGDALLFARMSATEELGRLFSFHLGTVSKNATIDLLALLGTPMTVKLSTDAGIQRFFSGIVREASQTGFENFDNHRYARYQFLLVPKPWLLTRKADCRIYKQKSVPDIIKLVLSEVGYTDVQLKLRGTYPPREYCVQYRESYFDFISRLMEQEGIYYYFVHDASTHTMVLSDGLDAHTKIKPDPEIMYRPDALTKPVDKPSMFSFQSMRNVQSNKYQLEDYDPLKPRMSLLATEPVGSPAEHHQVAGLDNFDYPGSYDVKTDGTRYAQVRIDALNAVQSTYVGSTDCITLATGGLFSLKAFPRKEFDAEYLVTSSTIEFEEGAYVSGGDTWSALINKFHAISSKQPFRTTQSTPRPIIAGLQTAVVCGSEVAEDIVVDKYSRVQVTFFWNKLDKLKHDISCPVRVATPWAGKQWGAIHIPRVGQEVVVSFLEGDPDRPLIVGSVYNADNMPPYELPAKMTQSGIKSRSHKGGTAANFNEIRFEDKMGSEELFTHAEKDHREEVENDHFVDIGNDETETIKGQRTHTIDKDETFTIKGKRTHDVTGLDKLTAHDNKTADVTLAYKLTAGTEISLVTGASSIVMKADGSIAIKGVSLTIDGQMTVDVHAGLSLTAKSDLTSEYSAEVMTTLKALMMTVKGTAMTQVSGGIIMIG